MASVFVIAESEQGAREASAAARALGDSVVLCTAGVPAITGVADKCVHIDVPDSNVVDDAYLSVIDAFEASGAQIVVAEQTMRVLSLVGRLAAAKHAAAITGVSSLNNDEATSLYFGGEGYRSAKPVSDVAVYVIAPGAFDASEATGTDIVEELAFEAPSNAVTKTGSEKLESSGVNLMGADYIVSCGRGFAEEEDLQVARDLAAKIGAEMGCTRPLAEGQGWFPREAYIGISGVMLSPKVAIVLGASGQMQHMVGLNAADTVIAVNKDKNAPIFNLCDIGFVGDVKEVVPALVAAL